MTIALIPRRRPSHRSARPPRPQPRIRWYA